MDKVFKPEKSVDVPSRKHAGQLKKAAPGRIGRAKEGNFARTASSRRPKGRKYEKYSQHS